MPQCAVIDYRLEVLSDWLFTSLSSSIMTWLGGNKELSCICWSFMSLGLMGAIILISLIFENLTVMKKMSIENNNYRLLRNNNCYLWGRESGNETTFNINTSLKLKCYLWAFVPEPHQIDFHLQWWLSNDLFITRGAIICVYFVPKTKIIGHELQDSSSLFFPILFYL